MLFDDTTAPAAIDPALEAEFSLRRRHPEREAIYADYRRRSAAFRASAGCLPDLPYGPGVRTRLDVFPAGAGAPILVFIHGGYWRALDKADFSFMAAPYVRAGISVVMPGYDLTPAVSLGIIVGQLRTAFDWVLRHAATFGADAGRIVLSGHSAGGHLAAALALDAAAPAGLRGVVGVSGVFDLVPLLRTSINADLRLCPAAAAELSPLHRLVAAGQAPAMPLLAVVGALETDGFRGQSRTFVAAWQRAGGTARYQEIAGMTHFSILDAITGAGPVLAAVCDLLGGQPT